MLQFAYGPFKMHTVSRGAIHPRRGSLANASGGSEGVRGGAQLLGPISDLLGLCRNAPDRFIINGSIAALFDPWVPRMRRGRATAREAMPAQWARLAGWIGWLALWRLSPPGRPTPRPPSPSRAVSITRVPL